MRVSMKTLKRLTLKPFTNNIFNIILDSWCRLFRKFAVCFQVSEEKRNELDISVGWISMEFLSKHLQYLVTYFKVIPQMHNQCNKACYVISYFSVVYCRK